MALTFGEIRKLVAPYAGRAGRCASDSETATFALQVLQYLLFSGDQASIRKLDISAQAGCFSLPAEVEVPLKVRINERSAEVWNKWCSFHSGVLSDKCHEAADVLMDEGKLSPLAYALPPGGSILGIKGNALEEPTSTVLVQGKDPTGRDIYTFANDEQVPGEVFNIVYGQVNYGKVRFGEVTAVTKSFTNSYVSCFAVDPKRNLQRFLGDWSPIEDRPLYRRMRLTGRQYEDRNVHLSMLVRVKLKSRYHDNEITFFDNSLAIILGAQRIQSEVNNDVQTANYKQGAVDNILDKEAGYKKAPGSPIDVYWPLSAGAIKNII